MKPLGKQLSQRIFTRKSKMNHQVSLQVIHKIVRKIDDAVWYKVWVDMANFIWYRIKWQS